MIKSHVLVHHAVNEDPYQPYTYVLTLISHLYNVNKDYGRPQTGVLTSVTFLISYFLRLFVSVYASANACERARLHSCVCMGVYI